MKDPRLQRAGVSAYNKPKATPKNPHHSHVVVAKQGNAIKTIRFGAPHVSGAGSHPASKAQQHRRKAFRDRFHKQLAQHKNDKMSKIYWANKTKW